TRRQRERAHPAPGGQRYRFEFRKVSGELKKRIVPGDPDRPALVPHDAVNMSWEAHARSWLETREAALCEKEEPFAAGSDQKPVWQREQRIDEGMAQALGLTPERHRALLDLEESSGR